jgi:hypothetical protein
MLLAKVRSAGFVVSSLVLLILMIQASAAATPEPAKNAVRAEGCVRAGVQPHCVVLRDLKTGRLYDLLFRITARPPVGLGIEFTGVLRPEPSSCMQGTAVEVTAWAHKASIQCSPGQAGKRGRANPQ